MSVSNPHTADRLLAAESLSHREHSLLPHGDAFGKACHVRCAELHPHSVGSIRVSILIETPEPERPSHHHSIIQAIVAHPHHHPYAATSAANNNAAPIPPAPTAFSRAALDPSALPADCEALAVASEPPVIVPVAVPL